MKFTSTQENFNHGISLVANLVGRSVGLPILNNVLLEVKDGRLILSVTNLEIGIKTEVRGKAEKEGSFTVNAKVLADYINILPSSNVVLELVDNQLKITCENFQTKIRGQKADEFPIIPVLESKNILKIDGKVLKEALVQTTFATSFDEMRPEINGILFNISQKNITLVATDSYRLAEKKITYDGNQKDKQIIIPLKTLQEIERILGNDPNGVELVISDNQVMFVINQTTVVSRVIEGNFPDYQQIVPDSFKTKATIEKNELIQATRAAALFARTGINDIKLNLNKDKIEIKTVNSQLGEQESVLNSEISGDGVSVTFNYKYLLDGLQSAKSGKLDLEINSASSPVVLRDTKDKDYLYLIMPIKQ